MFFFFFFPFHIQALCWLGILLRLKDRGLGYQAVIVQCVSISLVEGVVLVNILLAIISYK